MTEPRETVTVTKRFLAKLLGKQGSRRRRSVALTKRESIENTWGLGSVAIGTAAALVSGMDSVKKSDFLKKYWYAVPLLLVVVGYWLHRKQNKNGGTLIALGIFLGVQGFQNRPKDDKKDDKKGDKKETSGPDWSWNPYTLPAAGAQWMQTPSGHQLLLPAQQAAAYGWQSPQAPTQTADPAAVITRDIYQRRAA